MKRRKSYKALSLSTLQSVDTKIIENRVLGRAWAKQHPISVNAYTQVGDYNYNNILLHLKGHEAQDRITLTKKGTFNLSRYAEKKVLLEIAKFLKLNFFPLSGYITSGGTEANLYAMWLARNWAEKNNSQKKTHWIIPKTSHYSFYKALNVLGLENNQHHHIHLIEKNEQKITDFNEIKKILSNVNQDEFVVIALTAMTTEFGLIDPIEETVAYIRKAKMKNVFLHIDACFSGFVLPLIPQYKKIFSFPEISSLAVDFHKTFGGPIGSGAIFMNHDLYRYSEVYSSYLQGNADYTLLGSRNGISAIQMYELWQYKKQSLKKEIQEASKKTLYLYEKLSTIPEIDVLYKPFANYLIFSTHIVDEKKCKKFLECCNSFSVSSTQDDGTDFYKVIVDHTIPKKILNLFVKEISLCLKKNTTK